MLQDQGTENVIDQLVKHLLSNLHYIIVMSSFIVATTIPIYFEYYLLLQDLASIWSAMFTIK